ncbi:MAG: DinB family protein [Gemmatimonas sp.]
MQIPKQMMKRFALVPVAASCMLAACAQNSDSTTPEATTAAAAPAPRVTADLAKDVEGVEKKFVDLIKAMPDASMNWRPGAGVRSVREVALHVASENYYLPSLVGGAIAPESGLTSDYKTVEAYEKRDIPKDSVVAALEKSFAAFKQAMSADTASMSGEVDFFGTKMSRQSAWIGMVTHLHEHLGQAIAYARQNKVVPPWSK